MGGATMHGGAAVVASALQESAAMADYLPAADKKKMTQEGSEDAQQQQVQEGKVAIDNGSSWRRLEGKVAIVTGGARGSGEAIARLFVAHGACVVIADDAVDEAAGQALASSLGLGPCSYEPCDVSVEADVERAVRRAVARHGRLDVLVLCSSSSAGVQARGSSSILALDAAEFERVVRVNALGAALGMKHAAKAMLELQAGGSIVSVAGGMGLGPQAYTMASEHALVGITKNAACELGRHGIRVNCITAAASESEAAAADEQEQATLKLQSDMDIAEAVLFLASDESTYVSGHNLVVVTTAHRTVM